MSTYEKKTDWEEPAFSADMLACPLKENWVSFQLVDEQGKGDGRSQGASATVS